MGQMIAVQHRGCGVYLEYPENMTILYNFLRRRDVLIKLKFLSEGINYV